jgi:sulfoxide reductase catalytic subunit YedY
MLIKLSTDIPSSDITPESVYLARRQFMQGVLGVAAAGAGLSVSAAEATPGPSWLSEKISGATPAIALSEGDVLTPYDHAAGYNNFYEFGYEKTDPAAKSSRFNPHPWQVEIAGEVEKPGVISLEDILKKVDLEERVYRLRCVEAWSMVIPWVGFSLASLLKQFSPTSKAKYVAFTTVHRPSEMPGQRSSFSSIKWPYREGLRIDEAMNPLTLLAVGMYGKILPNQNGAPLRLVVPWKYGFKSIKSIVKIEFTEKEPVTTWSQMAPDEYGFYANVNPQLSHPRWSQAQERRLPSGLLKPNIIPTTLFNGYADDVAHLYQGMDLKKFY